MPYSKKQLQFLREELKRKDEIIEKLKESNTLLLRSALKASSDYERLKEMYAACGGEPKKKGGKGGKAL